MTARLAWDLDGRDWPNRDSSQFVQASGFRWHVQRKGAGAPLLLLHGSGASTHSFASLLPLLAQRFDVIAPDLPGQGFSAQPPEEVYSLPGMARAVAELLRKLEVEPALIIGHSAGAAVGVRMSLDRLSAPRAIVGVNAALLPFDAATAPIYSGLAKMLALNPVVPWLFTKIAQRGSTIERLIDETGSRISERSLRIYRRLAATTSHVSATLHMMANWNLAELQRDLPRLATPLHLIVGSRDRTISPGQAARVKELVAHCEVETLPGLGHLAHEESPSLVAEHIFGVAARYGVEARPA